MLATLIGVAGVANLNLAVANVALPDIGKHFDAGQTMVDLIAVGYSLGLAASVLYLGAIGDRYGRKTLLVLGMALTIPASILAAIAPTAQVLFLARVFGGVAAGMAYPTTLALITALWSGAERTKSIALWSALGGGMSALGPLLAGALLEGFDWWSVFIVSAPLAAIALFFAWRFVPAHVNETTEPVDHLGGILSIALVGTLVLAINLAPEPGKGTTAVILGIVALAAAGAFILRQRRVKNPLYDLHIAARPTFWVAALAGIIVFGSLMGAMFIGQQFVQNVLGYSTLQAGLAILPGAIGMIIVAPQSAKLVESRGSRFTLLVGDTFCLLAFLVMLLLWDEGASYFPVGLGFLFMGIGVGFAGTPGLALADRLGAGEEGGDGLGDGRPAARPRRGDPAVGLRRPPHRRLRQVLQRTDRRLPARRERQRKGPERTHQVLLQRRQHRPAIPRIRPGDRRRRPQVLPRRRRLDLRRRDDRRRRSASASSSSSSPGTTPNWRCSSATTPRTPSAAGGGPMDPERTSRSCE